MTAERQAQRAVAIMAQLTGRGEVALLHIRALSRLAAIYRIQGRYEKAEPLCQQALAQAETVLEPDHLEVATF
jgi:hypothetical protein